MTDQQNNTVSSYSPSPTLIIQEQISLRDKNWFNTGGNADFFCEPSTYQEFQEALAYGHHYSLPLFILGQGANIVISDAGFKGLVIRPQLNSISLIERTNTDVIIEAGSGTIMHDLITYCLDNNILGLEEFSGIPGTVGGSVYINIHYYEFLLSQFLIKAVIIHQQTGAIETVDSSWFNFGYNKSQLQTAPYFILSATFRLTPCSPLEAAFAKGRHREIIRHRTSRYPSKNTCGSFFRNFHENEVTLIINNKKMIYIAYYLDKIGIKGALTCGDAVVSYQHANMLVNRGNASTQDIIDLARTMQQKVYDQFGVLPQPECLFIGFDTYPLLELSTIKNNPSLPSNIL